tara:strand:+ start:357 stop:755 length:399 start_codon:yes stop_codon:yes gene_type:complete
MSKFLKLVEENRPGEDKYTVELRDVNGDIIDAFDLFGVGSPFEIFDSFKREYAPDIPVEDAEIKSGPKKYDIDREVSNLANKGLLQSPKGFKNTRAAKNAMKEREGLAVDAIGVYKKKSEELKAAIQDAEKA